MNERTADVVIVGAGAAGLATAIFAARARPALTIACLDGARHLGAKILVSGGTRCNVTNREVSARDYWGGAPRIVRHVLRAFPAARAAEFFEAIGVPLREEDDGKLFPVTGRSRTVLDALLGEAARLGITIQTGERVTAVARHEAGFIVEGMTRRFQANCVVLATGGRSLPKTGSDGFGYEIARRLGHGYVEMTPALAPLVLEGSRHRELSGVTHPATLSLHGPGGAVLVSLSGSLLWTHFGISGPVALNMSRHLLRARLQGGAPRLTVNVMPGESFDAVERWLVEQGRIRPRARVPTVLASRIPAALAASWTARADVPADGVMAHLTRDERRRLVHALTATTLDVRDSRGYSYAEVTAGGVPLDEIEPATMESKMCPGLFLVGEILDVDGRLGGFNFQWAWSSAFAAGRALAARLTAHAAANGDARSTARETNVL